MIDQNNEEIRLGDQVVFTAEDGYAHLEMGEVVGFTPQRVRITYRDRPGRSSVLRAPVSQVVVLKHDPTREQQLKEANMTL